VALRILSADNIEGETLLLSTAVGPDGTMYEADMANFADPRPDTRREDRILG
jgi:hypothetical protein